jgi:hypothetical protein
MGFCHLLSDASIFVWEDKHCKVIVPVFVDHMMLASKSKAKIAEFKEQLGKHFKFQDLGPTTFQLGVEVICNRPKRTLHLSQL